MVALPVVSAPSLADEVSKEVVDAFLSVDPRRSLLICLRDATPPPVSFGAIGGALWYLSSKRICVGISRATEKANMPPVVC